MTNSMKLAAAALVLLLAGCDGMGMGMGPGDLDSKDAPGQEDAGSPAAPGGTVN